jgi:hypothetical protein
VIRVRERNKESRGRIRVMNVDIKRVKERERVDGRRVRKG